MTETPLKRVRILQELVELTGGFAPAVVLNQFLYWSERTRDVDSFIREEVRRMALSGEKANIDPAHGWIYKSAEQLIDETMLGCSPTTMRKYVTHLVDSGWLAQRNNPKYGWDRTLQYRVDLRKIQVDLALMGYALEGYPALNPALYLGDPFPAGVDAFPKTGNGTPEIGNETPEIGKQYQILDTENTVNDLSTETAVEALRQASVKWSEGKRDGEPVPLEQRKQRIVNAIATGAAETDSIQQQVLRLFNISPNWNVKVSRDFVQWAKALPAGQTLGQFAGWWYQHDWRGQKGQPPTLGNIQELFPQAFADTVEDDTTAGKLEKQGLRRLGGDK